MAQVSYYTCTRPVTVFESHHNRKKGGTLKCLIVVVFFKKKKRKKKRRQKWPHGHDESIIWNGKARKTVHLQLPLHLADLLSSAIRPGAAVRENKTKNKHISAHFCIKAPFTNHKQSNWVLNAPEMCLWEFVLRITSHPQDARFINRVTNSSRLMSHILTHSAEWLLIGLLWGGYSGLELGDWTITICIAK